MCGLEIEIKNGSINGIMELHKENGEALSHIVDDQEKENDRINYRIAELNDVLSPRSLFVKPLYIVQLIEDSSGQS